MNTATDMTEMKGSDMMGVQYVHEVGALVAASEDGLMASSDGVHWESFDRQRYVVLAMKRIAALEGAISEHQRRVPRWRRRQADRALHARR